jgi:hypothetical protein
MDSSEIQSIAKQARSKAPITTGNCDYISRKFVEIAVREYGYTRDDFTLHVVTVTHSETQSEFTKGHWIVEICSENSYVDLTVDQFNTSNKSYHSFALGSQHEIPQLNQFSDLNETDVGLSYTIKRTKQPYV